MANKNIKTKTFNIFDLIIVIVLVLCILAIVFKYAFIKNDNSFTELRNVTFSVDEILEITADNIISTFDPNQELYISDSGEYVGILKSVEKHNSKLYVSEGDSVTLVSNPERFDLTGTAVLYGRQGANYFLVNGMYELKLDSTFVVYTTSAIFQIRITGIS